VLHILPNNTSSSGEAKHQFLQESTYR